MRVPLLRMVVLMSQFAAGGGVLGPAAGADPGRPAGDDREPVYIGSRLELFVDDYLVAHQSGLELRLHPPASAGTVLKFDQPWEGNSSTYITVFSDGDRFRMYYRASNREIPFGQKSDQTLVTAYHEFVGYAESRDGVTWTKPSLGLFEFNGSKENNIVWADKPGAQSVAACLFVFKDSNPAAPEAERYKMIGGTGAPLVVLVSPDGFHWKEWQGQKSLITEGLHGNAFDAQSTAFWDPAQGRYFLFFRDMDRIPHPAAKAGEIAPPYNYGVRTFKVTTSPDFIHWSMPAWADFGRTRPENFYTNAITPYFRAPHIFLGFPKRFQPWRAHFENWTSGVSDGVFISSRDGLHWDRTFQEAYVRPGRDEKNWGHRSTMAAAGILQTAPDEISLYYTRNYAFPTDHVERFVTRLDGFASMHAGAAKGEFVTRPFIFTGANLVLNYATSAAGGIRLEIQDPYGNPIPGFTLEESPMLWGDEIGATVAWPRNSSKTDKEPLGKLSGKPIRIRWVMEEADLFSFQFR